MRAISPCPWNRSGRLLATTTGVLAVPVARRRWHCGGPVQHSDAPTAQHSGRVIASELPSCPHFLGSYGNCRTIRKRWPGAIGWQMFWQWSGRLRRLPPAGTRPGIGWSPCKVAGHFLTLRVVIDILSPLWLGWRDHSSKTVLLMDAGPCRPAEEFDGDAPNGIAGPDLLVADRAHSASPRDHQRFFDRKSHRAPMKSAAWSLLPGAHSKLSPHLPSPWSSASAKASARIRRQAFGGVPSQRRPSLLQVDSSRSWSGHQVASVIVPHPVGVGSEIGVGSE
jgi:hypothetical protein